MAALNSLLVALRGGFILLLALACQGRADVDDSTDLYLTFAQPVMNDTSPYPYHRSISAWYESFLKVALQRKAWPVDAFAEQQDFDPIFEMLEETYPDQPVKDIGDDQWAEPFILKGQDLFHIAESYRSGALFEGAIKYYMRAANVFRLAYFPLVHEKTSKSKAKLFAWKMDKSAFDKAIELMGSFDYLQDRIPFESDDGGNSTGLDIPVRTFRSSGSNDTEPAVVIITGLDHYYTYMLDKITSLTSSNYTAVIVAMPGTADSPITGRDSLANEKYWTGILDWLNTKADDIDPDCISVWGISTGSYWAIRASKVEPARIKRAVSQGTASHYAFTRTWLEAVENLAYPASLQRALGQSFGYSDPEDFKKNVEQYSLLRQGLLDRDGAHLVAVNGEKDTIFPIDDQRILAEHGPSATLRWFPHVGHNGEPFSTPWLDQYWQSRGGC